MFFVGPDEVLEFRFMKVVNISLNTLGRLICIHEVNVADIFVPRLDKSASTHLFFNVAMGVITTMFCNLQKVIAHICYLFVC